MKCVKFWLDDPIEALQNLSSIIPRQGQCINEKLNALSFFSVVFSIILYFAKVPYSWAFAVFGLGISVFLKLVFFNNDLGELTYEEYSLGKGIQMGDIQRYLGDDEVEMASIKAAPFEFEDLQNEAHFIDTSPHDRRKYGETFEQLKGSVIDDLLPSRIPNVIPLTKRLGDICIV